LNPHSSATGVRPIVKYAGYRNAVVFSKNGNAAYPANAQ
jgi:hypothetical protein